MKRFIPSLVLAISGVLLLIIGSAVLLNAESFAAANGVDLSDSPSLLSEYRAPAGMVIELFLGAVCLVELLRLNRTQEHAGLR